MRNKLKSVTTSVIKELNEAEIRTIMATGDNILTAIHVARECNIITPNSEVILGDVEVVRGEEKVVWKSGKTKHIALNEEEEKH
jgi:cation-transporting ATPase 13A3/4/5